jgi:hypothetical protein
MTNAAPSGLTAPVPSTRLRLVPRARRRQARVGDSGTGSRPSLGRLEGAVLVAGGDAASRATLVEELAGSLPQGTSFQQADALWQLLAQAPESRMVVLSGALDDLAPESLLHTLAHRHPGLPVVSVEPAALVAA